MSVRCKFDGGEKYNRIEGGSFQYHCNGAGLAIQHGPDYWLTFWKKATNNNPGQVMTAYMTTQQQQRRKDQVRKQSSEYRKSSNGANSSNASQHHYGTNYQQEDLSPSELVHLCREVYECDIKVSKEIAIYIEINARNQTEDSLWHQQKK